MEQQMVVFLLANEQYGVEIAAVESIIKMQNITTVPHAPEFIEGVTNLRGKIVPVIDLRKRMGKGKEETTRDSRIVVVNIGGITAGLVVDAVSEVLRINTDVIESAPALTTSANSQFVRGIAKTGQNLVVLLDLKSILGLTEVTGPESAALAV